MKIFMVVTVIILGGAFAAYYYWQQTQPEPDAVGSHSAAAAECTA